MTIDESGCLKMHGLIQDMGREIVRKESPLIPGNRSRLWHYKDILQVLEENSVRMRILFYLHFFLVSYFVFQLRQMQLVSILLRVWVGPNSTLTKLACKVRDAHLPFINTFSSQIILSNGELLTPP